MSVVGAINTSFGREMGIGHRRVPATIAIPVVVACGMLGVVAGLLFPLPPAAVTRESPAFLSASRESMPKHQAGAGRATLTATPQSRHEGLAGPSASLARQPDQSAAPPQERASSELTRVAPPVGSQRSDLFEPPSQATSRVGEGRQPAKHNSLLSDRIRQAKRERSAAIRRRISGRERPAQRGQLSQLPFLGPVAGALLE
jgi:hypothetical protein